MEGTRGCRERHDYLERHISLSTTTPSTSAGLSKAETICSRGGKASPASTLPASPAQRSTKKQLRGLWVKPPLQHLQQTRPAEGFLFLPCPPPGIPCCLELHPGHRGERGRTRDVILALLNPGLMSLLLLVTVRGSGEIY